MAKPEGSQRRYKQIYVSPDVLTEVDTALPAVIGRTGRRLSRMEFVDELIKFGLRHIDDVAAVFTEGELDDQP